MGFDVFGRSVCFLSHCLQEEVASDGREKYTKNRERNSKVSRQIKFKVQKAFHSTRTTRKVTLFSLSPQKHFILIMADEKQSQTTDIEMKPVGMQEEKVESELPYKKGDMYA